MRIAPVLVPHLRRPTSRLWSDAAMAARITHNDSASTAACVAWIRLLWDLLGRLAPPENAWWVRTFAESLRELETDETYQPRSGQFADFRGPLWRFLLEHVWSEAETRRTVLDAANAWFSGAFVFETVPCVLHILTLHGHDPQEAIVRAVNDTKDNDTIAALVGAAVGALHGKLAFPSAWLDGLLGRTTEEDDGAVYHILDETRRIWWDGPAPVPSPGQESELGNRS